MAEHYWRDARRYFGVRAKSSKRKAPLSARQRKAGHFIFMVLLAGLFLFLFSAPSARADSSPVGCTGSGLEILLFTDAPDAHIGDTLQYSITVFNGTGVGPIVCDSTGIQTFVVTPEGAESNATVHRG